MVTKALIRHRDRVLGTHTLVADQDAVEEFPADGADEALGDGVDVVRVGSDRGPVPVYRGTGVSRDTSNDAGMESDLVQYRRDGHVVTITYNRPDKLNAIDGAMRTQINDAFARFRDDKEAWVGIVTGAGRAFCAGADLGSRTGNPAGEFPGSFWERPTVNSFESGWEIFKPVIAAVNGYCLGYGLTLLTWCDFVIASERALFGFPEVRVGVPTMVGALRLPQRINWQYAMELLLTGERIDAQRAREIGLAGWVVPPEELMDRAYALAERLLAGAPLAQRAIKEMAVRGPGLGTPDAIRFGETMRKVVLATADAAEGGSAVRDRRSPVWRGR